MPGTPPRRQSRLRIGHDLRSVNNPLGSPHGFEGEPQERTRLDLEADRHDGIGSLLQPQAEEAFVTRAEVADLAAHRQQALAVTACLRRIEFQLVLLLVVDIPAHGAAGGPTNWERP